jgi:hypothetical protein
MIEIDIKSDMPIVDEALFQLKEELNYYKSKQKIVKVIHGYGSSGTGGAIKKAVHQTLKQMKQQKWIKDYIPGEGFDLQSGFSSSIHMYKELLKSDRDYGKSNDGITYVIF